MAKRSDSDTINHLGIIRTLVKGVGDLKFTAYSYSFSRSKTIPTITMQSAGDRLPTPLANFQAQKMCLEFRTTEIDEYFTISRITPFIRPVEMEYPR